MHFPELSLVVDCFYYEFLNCCVWVLSICLWEDASLRFGLDDSRVSVHHRVWRFESEGSSCAISASYGAFYRTLCYCPFCSSFLDAFYLKRTNFIRFTYQSSIHAWFENFQCKIHLKLLLSLQKVSWWMIFEYKLEKVNLITVWIHITTESLQRRTS